MLLVAGSGAALFPLIGTDFFPTVDAGLIRLHVRCPPGTRIEETERYFAGVADVIREEIPPQEVETVLDNLGIPYSGINLSPERRLADVVGRRRDPRRASTEPRPNGEHYLWHLRKRLVRDFPDLTFFFAAPDMVTQVLNFGLSAPIDILVSGPIQKHRRECTDRISHAV